MTDFTPWQSLLGGGLIGLAVVALMAAHGRIAGMTGILSGLLTRQSGPGWRVAFLAGAIAAPAVLGQAGVAVPFDSPTAWPWVALSGLLVGIGVTFGGGCTSGHGVCGLARLSKRSAVAAACFMATAAVTVYLVRHAIPFVFGGL